MGTLIHTKSSQLSELVTQIQKILYNFNVLYIYNKCVKKITIQLIFRWQVEPATKDFELAQSNFSWPRAVKLG